MSNILKGRERRKPTKTLKEKRAEKRDKAMGDNALVRKVRKGA